MKFDLLGLVWLLIASIKVGRGNSMDTAANQADLFMFEFSERFHEDGRRKEKK